MGNFSTFCKEEKELTEKEIGEVIVIPFFLIAYDFCDKSYIYVINLIWQRKCKEFFCGWERSGGRANIMGMVISAVFVFKMCNFGGMRIGPMNCF